ncbi:MAG TPA: M67 family metallopeptidase [bacterium]|nr:M67 family metallopeptidase [bacterium]
MPQPLLSIPSALLEQCFAHGAETYPEEACGVLHGPLSDAMRLVAAQRLPNILNQLHVEDPERYPRTAAEGYVIDPQALFRLEQRLKGQGQAVRVIYHTHVDVGAYFSEEDKRRALWAGQPLLPGVVYLVCGVKARRPDGAVLAWFDDASADFTVTPLPTP